MTRNYQPSIFFWFVSLRVEQSGCAFVLKTAFLSFFERVKICCLSSFHFHLVLCFFVLPGFLWSHKVLSYTVLSHFLHAQKVLSYVVLSHFFQSQSFVLLCIVTLSHSHKVLSYVVLLHFFQSHDVLSYIVLLHFLQSHKVLSYVVLSHFFQSQEVLSYVILLHFLHSHKVLSYILLSHFFQSYEVQSYVVLSHFLQSVKLFITLYYHSFSFLIKFWNCIHGQLSAIVPTSWVNHKNAIHGLPSITQHLLFFDCSGEIGCSTLLSICCLLTVQVKSGVQHY